MRPLRLTHRPDLDGAHWALLPVNAVHAACACPMVYVLSVLQS
jgi:hypothetical protein